MKYPFQTRYCPPLHYPFSLQPKSLWASFYCIDFCLCYFWHKSINRIFLTIKIEVKAQYMKHLLFSMHFRHYSHLRTFPFPASSHQLKLFFLRLSKLIDKSALINALRQKSLFLSQKLFCC